MTRTILLAALASLCSLIAACALFEGFKAGSRIGGGSAEEDARLDAAITALGEAYQAHEEARTAYEAAREDGASAEEVEDLRIKVTVAAARLQQAFEALNAARGDKSWLWLLGALLGAIAGGALVHGRKNGVYGAVISFIQKKVLGRKG